MRIGQSVFFPVMGMINFIIISYSLTDISKYVSMEYYVPIVIIGLVTGLIGIGSMFRKKQQSTDFTISYENNPEFIRDMDALMSGDPSKIKARQEYHHKVLKRHSKK
jgi:general stress protein CsbA